MPLAFRQALTNDNLGQMVTDRFVAGRISAEIFTTRAGSPTAVAVSTDSDLCRADRI